ncbi:MAG: carboxypeptidase regulatory-like domain-containing protein [Longimicrobiales bacterium]
MDKRRPPLEIVITLKTALPAVYAGAAYALSLVVKWPEGVAREAASFLVKDGKRTIDEGTLPEAATDGSVAFALRAPDEVKEHHLSVVVASAAGDGERAEGVLPFVLKTLPHDTSLAVWDIPSPIVRGAKFELKAGAKCAASCGLGGKVIEIRDEAEKVIGSGALGDAVLEGTSALHFATIALKAPRKVGLTEWTASFAPSELKLPHGGATSRFSFVAVAEPEHAVSVKVVNKETKAPIAGAQVRVGVYRAVTDESGAAKVAVPKGKFPLIVTRPGYAMPERNINVAKDVRVRITAEKLPEADPFALWTA